MKHTSRKNPVYDTCEEAVRALTEELLNVDFEKVGLQLFKDYKAHNFQQKPSDFQEELVWKFASARSSEELDAAQEMFKEGVIFEVIDDHGTFERRSPMGWLSYWLSENAPLRYVFGSPRWRKDVRFWHFFPNTRKGLIESEGLYGRLTPSRLRNSRNVADIMVRNNGYIFAYSADFVDSNYDTLVVSYRNGILGEASEALEFYYLDDMEPQTIVPLKCVTQSMLSQLDDSQRSKQNFSCWVDEDYHWETCFEPNVPSPKAWELGASVECSSCGERFELYEGALRGQNELICKVCRP